MVELVATVDSRSVGEIGCSCKLAAFDVDSAGDLCRLATGKSVGDCCDS